MRKMYYAHPMSYYGTAAEQADLALIADASFEVINPNAVWADEAVRVEKAAGRGGMAPFEKVIREEADVIAVRPFNDGRLGAGVAKELFEAIIWGKPVYVLGKGPAGVERLAQHPNPRSLLVGVLTVDETRRRVRRGEL